MRTLEIARRLAQLNEVKNACQAYMLAIQESGGQDPAAELEAAVYILRFGSGEDYKISYTVFRDLYGKGLCREDILELMTGAFYTPNVKMMQSRYRKNCALLEKYPYIFRKAFPKFEDLPLRFYPFDDNSYTPFDLRTGEFGEYINLKDPVIKHYFFKDLENPILAKDIYSQYELEYLRDNVRRSEDVARENHVYLHYSSWEEFCSYLACLNVRPLLEEKKFVFLFEEEIEQYPIDFKERYNIDYSQMTAKPIAIREINRVIWHAQLSSHNGGDMFNEVFDAHPNLLAMPSIMIDNIKETISNVKNVLEECTSLEQALYTFEDWKEPRLVEELYHNRGRTDKDILLGMYMYRKEYSRFMDPNSRIAPALFFQPHFSHLRYALKVDEKDRAMLCPETDDIQQTMSIFAGFKYVKTFIPMRRFTTSHGATVRFMQRLAMEENSRKTEEDPATIVTDAVSERVLNRGFMADPKERIYRDSVIVRFEDGKLNTEATFRALAEFLDLPYTESMTYCSEKGGPVNMPGNAVGFDPVTVYRTYDEYINDSERIFIEYFLRDAYKYYGYDFQYYDGTPMTLERAQELVKGFDTMNQYMRETWRLVFRSVKVARDGQGNKELEEFMQAQMLDHYMEDIDTNRMNTVDILMGNLQFIGKNGQPLRMIPLLKLDPALMVAPLYH